MRAFPCLILALLALAPAARAQEAPGPQSAAAPAPSRAERLDALFADLRRESDAAKAEAIAARIQREWDASGSATTDLLMGRAAQAASRNDEAAALDMLDQAIVLDPAYAEAWNRRATLHYAQDRYRQSLADVAETLRREPRHFGSLLGLGAILEERGRRREALAAYERALAVYPALKAAQDAALRLSEALAGERA